MWSESKQPESIVCAPPLIELTGEQRTGTKLRDFRHAYDVSVEMIHYPFG